MDGWASVYSFFPSFSSSNIKTARFIDPSLSNSAYRFYPLLRCGPAIPTIIINVVLFVCMFEKGYNVRSNVPLSFGTSSENKSGEIRAELSNPFSSFLCIAVNYYYYDIFLWSSSPRHEPTQCHWALSCLAMSSIQGHTQKGRERAKEPDVKR